VDLTFTEENYLKAILKLSLSQDKTVSTNEIAAHLRTTAASVTDMLKKLSEKELIHYQRYRGVWLTEEGNKIATQIVRRHRLWEVFLGESLGMKWDEIHDIAEELEHIKSDLLVDRLDSFLGSPKFDPHGDPIPNAQGKYTLRAQLPLTELQPGQSGLIIGVRESDPPFLKHLTEKGISIGKNATLLNRDHFDQSINITIDNEQLSISGKVAQNILIKIV